MAGLVSPVAVEFPSPETVADMLCIVIQRVSVSLSDRNKYGCNIIIVQRSISKHLDRFPSQEICAVTSATNSIFVIEIGDPARNLWYCLKPVAAERANVAGLLHRK
jgi:hypothetical protein